MKQIVLTGPTSMLGIALIKKCIEEGTKVLAIANPGSAKIKEIPGVPGTGVGEGLVKVIECSLQDIRDLNVERVTEFLDAPDCFFHLGWAATTHEGRMNVYPHIDNITYTIDAVELASRMGCKKFVGAGSQAEYGRTDMPLKGDTPAKPEVPYGVAKLAAGQMSRIRCNQLGMEHVWVRILSAYGPFDSKQTLVSTLVKTLFEGGHFATTKGEQIWDFIHASDVAKALYLIGEKGVSGKIYPIGSGTGRPLKEFICKASDIAVKNNYGQAGEASLGFGEIPYGPLQIMHLKADISELTEDTGFVPEVSFEEGIKALLEM